MHAPALRVLKSKAELRSFHGSEDKSFWVICFLYLAAVVGVCLALLALRQEMLLAIPLGVLAFAFIGWAQFSLGNGLHEAVHFNLRNRKNERSAAIFTAYPIGLTMGYRRVHLMHHRYLATERDPDLMTFSDFPVSRLKFLGRLLYYVSGFPAAMQFLEMVFRRANTGKARESARSNEIFWLLGVQAIIALVFYGFFGNPFWYFVFWVAPIATIGKLLSTTRALCEHGSPCLRWVVRSLDASRWQTWLMGAFDFNYHGVHHLYPSVPYAHLERLHRVHEEYRAEHPDYQPFDGRFEVFEGGYLNLLAHWFRMLPWVAWHAR
jgi:fatty acid desaturase